MIRDTHAIKNTAAAQNLFSKVFEETRFVPYRATVEAEVGESPDRYGLSLHVPGAEAKIEEVKDKVSTAVRLARRAAALAKQIEEQARSKRDVLKKGEKTAEHLKKAGIRQIQRNADEFLEVEEGLPKSEMLDLLAGVIKKYNLNAMAAQNPTKLDNEGSRLSDDEAAAFAQMKADEASEKVQDKIGLKVSKDTARVLQTGLKAIDPQDQLLQASQNIEDVRTQTKSSMVANARVRAGISKLVLSLTTDTAMTKKLQHMKVGLTNLNHYQKKVDVLAASITRDSQKLLTEIKIHEHDAIFKLQAHDEAKALKKKTELLLKLESSIKDLAMKLHSSL